MHTNSSTYEDRHLDERALAERLCISVAKLRADRRLKRGIPFVKFGAAVRYLICDVHEFERRARVVPAAFDKGGV